MDDSSVPDVVVPVACPFCSSAAISTTSNATSSSTYWRCAACSQIWNPNRRLDLRPPDTFRWRGRGRF